MKRHEYRLRLRDGKDMHVYVWQSEHLAAKAVIQIAHGMAEHALRYDPFSKWLTEHGFIVYANDHRGHGKTYQSEKEKGFFATDDGFQIVVNDLADLTKDIKVKHPDLPIFLLGHSMGSFLVRRLIQLQGEMYTGVILSGTSDDQKLLGKLGLLVAKLEKKMRGPYAKSRLMNYLIFGGYNKNFPSPRTDFDFLSRDAASVDAYIADKNCGFICTTSFYVDLLSGLQLIHRQSEMMKTPKDLPIFFIAGDKDPVGNNGKGVQNVYEQYVNLGFRNVFLKLYEGGRHEMLNETNRQEVYEDITNWLDSIMKGKQFL